MDETVRGVPDDRVDIFDPSVEPRLFVGVRWRRSIAFLIDAAIVLMLTLIAGVGVFVLGIFTFGLAWMIYVVLWQAVALAYTALTLGGPASATPGMRAMGLEMRLWYGDRVYPLLAVVHALFFWFSVALLTPFILLVTFLDGRKRLLHDLVLGTVMVDAEALKRL